MNNFRFHILASRLGVVFFFLLSCSGYANQTAFGSGFLERRERLLTPTGLDLPLTDITRREWSNNLVSYRLRLRGVAPAQVWVEGPDGLPIPSQCDPGLALADGQAGDREARLMFFASRPENGAVVYRIRVGSTPPDFAGGSPTLTPSADGQSTVLDNGVFAVRLPPLGEVSYAAPLPLSAVALPILQVRLRNGSWVGSSTAIGNSRRVLGIKVLKANEGPILAEALIRYRLEATTPGAAEGYWIVSLRAARGLPLLMVEEEIDTGLVTESTPDRWRLDLAGSGVDTALGAVWANNQDQDHPFKIPGSELFGDRYEGPALFERPVTTTPIGLDKADGISPFQAYGSSYFWVGARQSAVAEPNFIGLVPMHGGSWRRWPKIRASVHPGGLFRLDADVGINTAPEPVYSLSTAADDADLARSTARRQWGLCLGAPVSAYELGILRCRYGSLSLDDIKEWDLDWPGMSDLSPATYPRLYSTPALAAATRAAYTANTLPEGDRASIANFGSYTGNWDRDKLFHLNGGPVTLDDTPNVWGAEAGVFWPVPTYRTGQNWMGGNLPYADDNLADPAFTGPQRQRLLRRLAMFAYLYASSEFAPLTSGAHQGNPNMPLNRSAALPGFAALIPNHPQATAWRDLSCDYYRNVARTYASMGGGWREASASYEAASLPFLQYAALAFGRLGRSLDLSGLYDNAVVYATGTTTPIVARYGARVREPFGNSGIVTQGSPLVTALVLAAAGDMERARQAVAAYDQVDGTIPNYHTDTGNRMLVGALAGIRASGAATVDRGSKLIPGFGASLRGRPGTPQESFLLLRGGYNSSHMDPEEQGAFAFHTAGDELIGWPDNGYIRLQNGWDTVPGGGSAWSTLKTAGSAGEFNDVGFTTLADYAAMYGGRTRRNAPNGWIRQTLLVKGELSYEYDYAVFRDASASNNAIGGIHLATRLPAANWTPLPGGADLAGRFGGHARLRVLHPATTAQPTPAGLEHVHSEFPMSHLRNAFAGTLDGRPESPARVAKAETAKAKINEGVSDPSAGFTASHSSLTIGTGPATRATWIISGQTDPARHPVAAALADGVVKVVSPAGTDYVFLRDADFTYTDAEVSFTGRAGVIRVRGTAVTLALNAGTGGLSYQGVGLQGTGPLLRSGSLAVPSLQTVPAPASTITYSRISGVETVLAPGVTLIEDAATQRAQYIVESPDGSPVTFDQPGNIESNRLTVAGIIQGAITIDPLGADIVVVRGDGLFNARGHIAIGAGPFALRRTETTLAGRSEGPARIIQAEGFEDFRYYRLNGSEYATEKTGGIWLSNLPVKDGPCTFSIESYEGRARTLPHPHYSLDRLPVRVLTTPPSTGTAPLFTGAGYWDDPARWSTGAVPPAGADIAIAPGSELLVTNTTPRWGRVTLIGSLRFVGVNGLLQADTLDLHGLITHPAQFSTQADSQGDWPVENRVALRVGQLTIHPTGAIDTTGKGWGTSSYPDKRGAGPGGGGRSESDPTGSSHGGTGGLGSLKSALPGPAYGDHAAPAQPGSGPGGNGFATGGGLIDIEVTGLFTHHGLVSADATDTIGQYINAGGASGGGVRIRAGAITGTGRISADGGDAKFTPQGAPTGGGGGGGRIAITWSNLALQSAQTPALRLSVAGGRGIEAGESGTLYLTDASFFPTPIISTDARLSVASGLVLLPSLQIDDTRDFAFENLPVVISGPVQVHGRARLRFLGGSLTAQRLLATDDARVGFRSAPSATYPWGQDIALGQDLQLLDQATLALVSDPATGTSTRITAKNLLVATAAALHADLGGYPGRVNAAGTGPGAGLRDNNGMGRGAGHGGTGARSRDVNQPGGAPYGDPQAPVLPGSSGGGDGNNGGNAGGSGGGVIRLDLTGLAHIDGRLSADGGYASGFRPGTLAFANMGGGSGGSIWLTTHRLQGSGTIRARGGEGNPNGGAGGGGRILIENVANDWTGSALTLPIATPVGAVGQSGFAQNGTVVLRTLADATTPAALPAPTYAPATRALSGSVSSPGILTILDGDTEVAVLDLAASGPWSHVFTPPLSAGLHALSYTFLPDAASGPALVSERLYVTLAGPPDADLTPPGTPAAPRLVNELPVRLLLDGSTEPGATVRLYLNDGLLQTLSTNALGYWSYSVPGPLDPAGYRFRIIAVDPSGNVSAPSPETMLAGAAPVATPVPGTYYAPFSVTLEAPLGATIRYTVDGAAPGPDTGTVYTGPIPLSSGARTLRAVAVGATLSPVTTITYTVLPAPTALAPTFSPAPGNFESGQPITLASATPGTRIRYTLDGSIPTTGSPDIASGGSIYPPAGPVTLRAVAYRPDYEDSAITVGTYTILPLGSDWRLFSHLTGPFGDNNDGTSYELGAKFRVIKPGRVTAIRYYRAPSETGTHTGRLWRVTGTQTGTQLASVTFTAANDAAGAGWREQALASPVTLLPGETYLASVNINTHYVLVEGGLAEAQTRGPLIALGAINGFFGPSGQYPASSYNNSNYLRDVAFQSFAPREAWRHARFGTDQPIGNAADLADPDGDGLPNLLEYALNREPLAAGGATATTHSIDAPTGKLRFTFRRARPAHELTYTVQASSDLATWTAIATNPGGESAVGADVTVLDNSPPGTPRRFLRLQLTTP